MSCAHENIDEHPEGLQCRDCKVVGEFVSKDLLAWMMKAYHLKPGEHVVSGGRPGYRGLSDNPVLFTTAGEPWLPIIRSYEAET